MYSRKPSPSEMVSALNRDLPNLPLTELYEEVALNGIGFYNSLVCTALPCLFDLKINNGAWTKFTTGDHQIDMYLISAFLDVRYRTYYYNTTTTMISKLP